MKTAMAIGGTALIALGAFALVSFLQSHVGQAPVVGSYLPGGK